MKENICDILVSNRRQDCDRAPVSESEVFYLRSNVELRRGSKFPFLLTKVNYILARPRRYLGAREITSFGRAGKTGSVSRYVV